VVTERTTLAPSGESKGLHVSRTERADLDRMSGDWVERSVGTSSGLGGLLMMLQLSQSDELVKPYLQSPMVYACTQAIARAFCAVPVRLMDSRDEDAEDVPPDDPMARLLVRPNPLMGGQKFMRSLAVNYCIAGGTVIFMSRTEARQPIEKGGMPNELWPVREDIVQIEVDEKTGLPAFYSYPSSTGERVKFPAHSVAHVYEADPYNLLVGAGPLMVAYRSALHLYQAERFDDALLKNGGQMGGVFVHEEKRLTPEQTRVLTNSISQNATKPENDRKTPVLPAGIKFIPTSFTQVDMQAQVLRLMKQDDIRAIFGVPKPLLANTDDVNRAASNAVRRVFYENTIIPLGDFVQEELAVSLLGKIGGQEERWIKLDYSKVAAMREDADQQIERVTKLTDRGVSMKDAATMVGWDVDIEGVEGSDERWIATNLQPVDLALEPPEPVVAPVAPGAAPKPKPEAASFTPDVERDGAARRRAAVDAEEQRLAKHDRRAAKAVFRVFSEYVLAQRKKLREIAAQAGGRSIAVRPWHELLGTAARVSPEWAEALECDRGWIEVRGVTEDELLELVLGNIERWNDELWGALKKPLTETLDASARAAQTRAGGVQVGGANPEIIDFLRQTEIHVKEGPMSVVAEQVRAALIRGLAESPPVGTLPDRVRMALESVESELRTLQTRLGTRATMIARTEVASASSVARAEQFRSDGIVHGEWGTSEDDTVREHHQIDGEVAVIGDRFSNGMRYPGDPQAPPGMRINERCALLPVIPDAP
jgi:HK97 family phage portal protein